MRLLSSAFHPATGTARQHGARVRGPWKWLALATIAILSSMQTACSPSAKVTAQDAAVATQTLNETTSTAAAIAKSHYRTYRWVTPEEIRALTLAIRPGVVVVRDQAVRKAGALRADGMLDELIRAVLLA